MKVRAWDFFAVRVAVRRNVKVQSHQYDRRPCPVLIGRFRKPNLGAGHIEHEVFPLVHRGQWNCSAAARRWKQPFLFIDPPFSIAISASASSWVRLISAM